MAAAFRDLLWPRSCLACGSRAVDGVMCLSCRRRSKRAEPAILHPGEQRVRPAFALWKFERDAPIRAVLHRLKYGNCPWIGYSLGKAMAASFPPPVEAGWDLILPVPLYSLRLLERGYNQSDWIARGLGDALEVPVMGAELKRLRSTASQTNLTREERRANVEGAFSLSGRCTLEKSRVILVDDTLTTGATLLAAARILVDAGARFVQPAAVARATLRLDEEQPDAASVISSQSSLYGTSSVGYNL